MLLIYYSTFQKIMSKEKEVEVTRLEVINHADNDRPIGRILTMHTRLGDFKNLEVQYQDGGRTLKIFLR